MRLLIADFCSTFSCRKSLCCFGMPLANTKRQFGEEEFYRSIASSETPFIELNRMLHRENGIDIKRMVSIKRFHSAEFLRFHSHGTNSVQIGNSDREKRTKSKVRNKTFKSTSWVPFWSPASW